jgi:2-isopropylmalate synthase
VLLETSDGTHDWTTVGVHENVVEASWHAMVDALTFGLAQRAQAVKSAGSSPAS